MRFLFGIITGTLLTLAAATAIDPPGLGKLRPIDEHLAGLWDSLIHTASAALFRIEDEHGDLQALAAREAGLRPDEQAHQQPARALPAPAPLPAPPPVEPATRAPQEPQVKADLASEDVAVTPTIAKVWYPFHSQMSAEGFANRLSQALDHGFQVERQGAGAYQVVFEAASDSEKELLLAQIAEITGQ